MHHEKPDPNACPRCSARNSISEHANRITWQPIEQLDYDADGVLVPVEWGMFETGDETENETYYCQECGDEWPTLSALAYAQRLTKALTDHRDFWEDRAERLKDLASGDRLDTVDGAEKIADAQARGEAFEHALAILRGNGEA